MNQQSSCEKLEFSKPKPGRKLQENLRMMGENMQKAMDNMQMMTQRMGEISKK